MGNLCCFLDKTDENQVLIISKKTCPHCIHIFRSEKEKNKHIPKCLYNKGDNSYIDQTFSSKNIYSGEIY